jgi:xanthine/uracil/vitamin C permease (AzgA family)
MPSTYSIANGISLGLVSWVAIELLAAHRRELDPLRVGVVRALVAFDAGR